MSRRVFPRPHPERVPLPCASLDDVPPAEELARLACGGQEVVLRLPPLEPEPRENLRCQLQEALPEHHVSTANSVVDVTITKIIDRSAVEGRLSLWLGALLDYTRTGRELVTRLAATHGLNPADLHACWRKVGAKGQLGDWRFLFHGDECLFEHAREGTVVEVIICHGDEFGALNEYFFSLYVRSSPAQQEAAALLADDDHLSCRRVFEILTRLGWLEERVLPVTYWNNHTRECLLLARRGRGSGN